tara:strand:- start:2005 stop:2346 length:342 start_codon:yes stop_codon:yes gene_type:complete
MSAHYDLNITKGSSFSVRLVALDDSGSALDLTSWSVRGLAKLRYSSSETLINLNPQKVPQHETDGYVDINLTAAQTELLPVTEGVFDIEIFDGNGFVKKLIIGYARVYPEATV